jgi:hypothetical protein
MRLLSEAENGKRELARGPGSAAERAARNFGSRGVLSVAPVARVARVGFPNLVCLLPDLAELSDRFNTHTLYV